MTDLPRRAMLLGALAGTALVAVGCSTDSIPIIGRKDPDEDLRLVTAAAEQDLIAAYDAVIAAKPALAEPLGRIRAQHQAHQTALLDGLEAPVGGSAPAVGGAGAVRALRRLESGAARQRAQACGAAEDPRWVQLFAMIGASEAGHAAALAGLV